MTVQNVDPCVEYVGNDAQTSFAFVFRADDETWITLNFTDNFDSIILNADQDINPGGDVIYSVAPPTGQLVSILRSTPIDQDLDYTRYDPFDSESHEDALDKLTMIIQDLFKSVFGSTAGGTGIQDQIDDLQNQIDNINQNIFGSFCIENQIRTSVGGVLNLDYTAGMGVTLQLTEDITTINFLNIPTALDVCQFEFDIRQDAPTDRSINWPATIIWPGAQEPIITTPGSVHQIHLRTTNGGLEWLGSYVLDLQ